jgi:hypothetical protein
MDSTLTAAEVKDYILRGAREPKGWDAQGNQILATPVDGTTEEIYQLDAYGALSLLSRERQNVPLCGIQIGVNENQIVLHRDQEQQVAVSAYLYHRTYSVAQGGRRLAIPGIDGQTPFVTVLDHRLQAIDTITGLSERYYLERDTADVSRLSEPDGMVSVTFRGPGGTETVAVSARVPAFPGWTRYAAGVSPSPDGQWIAVNHALVGPNYEIIVDDDTVETHDLEFRWDLVPSAAAGAVVGVYDRFEARQGNPCLESGAFCDSPVWITTPPASWSASSRRAWMFTNQSSFAALRALLFNVPLAGGVPQPPGPPVTLTNLWVLGSSFHPLEQMVLLQERSGAGCEVRNRLVTDAAPFGTPLADCDDRRMFNAPTGVVGHR